LGGLSTSWRSLPRRSTPSTASTRRDWDAHHGDGTNDIFRTSDAVPVRQHPSVRHPSWDGTAASCEQRGGRGLLDQPPVPARSARTRGYRCSSTSPCPPLRWRLYARGAAGDEPPEMVAPHFLTARAASHIGYCRAGGRGCATSHTTTAVRNQALHCSRQLVGVALVPGGAGVTHRFARPPCFDGAGMAAVAVNGGIEMRPRGHAAALASSTAAAMAAATIVAPSPSVIV
jgi:hypothetical protein